MNEERPSSLRNLQARMRVGQVSAYYPKMAHRAGGVKAAVMLSQLLFWSASPGAQERGGWVYKSVEQMERETGLTKCEQQTARKALAALGLIDARLKGIPRVWYYRVCMDRLAVVMGDAPAEQPSPREDAVSKDFAAHQPHRQPRRIPLDYEPPFDNEQRVPTLGGTSAQLNESENTTENSRNRKSEVRVIYFAGQDLAFEDRNGKTTRSDPRAAKGGPPPADETGTKLNPENLYQPETGATGGDRSGHTGFSPELAAGKKTPPERFHDPRAKHPAVLLVKQAIGRYPPRAVFDRIIQTLGDIPDARRFAEAHEAWCARGYRPTNLDGILDWYRKGIPPVRSTYPTVQMPPVKLLEEEPRTEAEVAEIRARLRENRAKNKKKN